MISREDLRQLASFECQRPDELAISFYFQPSTPKDKSLNDGIACDEIGCVARLADGTMVALPFAAEAFEEDCRRAALVISQRTAPPSCGVTRIDRAVWPRTGATALYHAAKGWETVVAFPPGYDRRWARGAAPRAESDTPSATATPAPRDATPRAEDLAPED